MRNANEINKIDCIANGRSESIWFLLRNIFLWICIILFCSFSDLAKWRRKKICWQCVDCFHVEFIYSHFWIFISFWLIANDFIYEYLQFRTFFPRQNEKKRKNNFLSASDLRFCEAKKFPINRQSLFSFSAIFFFMRGTRKTSGHAAEKMVVSTCTTKINLSQT